MNFRRLILSLFFMSMGHIVLGQAAVALISTEINSSTQRSEKDPCVDEETEADCQDQEAALSQSASDKDNFASDAVIKAAECDSNSCAGVECLLRGSCGFGAIYLSSNVSIFSSDFLARYSEFIPDPFSGFNPSPPTRPPIS